MIVTREAVAHKIADYLHHDLSIAELVEWAEVALLEGELAESDAAVLRKAVGRLGLSDVREFGLTWEDCERLLSELGFRAKVDVVSV